MTVPRATVTGIDGRRVAHEGLGGRVEGSLTSDPGKAEVPDLVFPESQLLSSRNKALPLVRVSFYVDKPANARASPRRTVQRMLQSHYLPCEI